MTITAADVKTIATELAAVDDAVFTPLIAMAERRINRTQWGARADDGAIFLVAHLVKMQLNAAAAGAASQSVGPVKSETMGPISRTYADASTASAVPFSAAWFNQTTWGQAYNTLRAECFPDRVGAC